MRLLHFKQSYTLFDSRTNPAQWKENVVQHGCRRKGFAQTACRGHRESADMYQVAASHAIVVSSLPPVSDGLSYSANPSHSSGTVNLPPNCSQHMSLSDLAACTRRTNYFTISPNSNSAHGH
jgi:hypothetical protein